MCADVFQTKITFSTFYYYFVIEVFGSNYLFNFVHTNVPHLTTDCESIKGWSNFKFDVT